MMRFQQVFDMSYTTELTEDCMGIVHVGTGVVRGQDLIEACKSTLALLQATENFHYEFIDFSDTTELCITPVDFEQIIAQDHFAALLRPEAVVVIVAPDDEIFQTVQEWDRRVQDIGWKTHLSRSRAPALKWLRENYPKPADSVAAESGGTLSELDAS
ncbi:MAG: hypothetical protein ACR2MW_04120 [Chthoniobacterales bacterium]